MTVYPNMLRAVRAVNAHSATLPSSSSPPPPSTARVAAIVATHVYREGFEKELRFADVNCKVVKELVLCAVPGIEPPVLMKLVVESLSRHSMQDLVASLPAAVYCNLTWLASKSGVTQYNPVLACLLGSQGGVAPFADPRLFRCFSEVAVVVRSLGVTGHLTEPVVRALRTAMLERFGFRSRPKPGDVPLQQRDVCDVVKGMSEGGIKPHRTDVYELCSKMVSSGLMPFDKPWCMADLLFSFARIELPLTVCRTICGAAQAQLVSGNRVCTNGDAALILLSFSKLRYRPVPAVASAVQQRLDAGTEEPLALRDLSMMLSGLRTLPGHKARGVAAASLRFVLCHGWSPRDSAACVSFVETFAALRVKPTVLRESILEDMARPRGMAFTNDEFTQLYESFLTLGEDATDFSGRGEIDAHLVSEAKSHWNRSRATKEPFALHLGGGWQTKRD